MKKHFSLILLLLFALSLQAQTAAEVDSIVRGYPKHFSSTEKLAQRIRSDFSTEYGKARAIYAWLGFHIKYDVKAYLHPKRPKPIKFKNQEERLIKERKLVDKRIARALSKHKGVCQHYAELFDRIATQAGLQSQINVGDAKTRYYDIGRRKVKVSHAWNSVKIDGVWRLIDATWGAGYVDLKKEKFYRRFNPLYFDMPPKLFFKEHYPAKGMWFDTEVDKTEFLKEPLINGDILNGRYEIIQPKSGVVEVCQNDTVTFKIRNVSLDSDIQYSVKRQDEIGEVMLKKQVDDAIEFEIVIDKKIPRYLTIFVEGKAIATFKVTPYKE